MEVHDGLSKGVIDGVNTPFETLKTFRFAEVAKYTTSSWPVGNLYIFYVIMNKNSYEKLPPDLKEILDKLSGEYKEKFGLMWHGGRRQHNKTNNITAIPYKESVLCAAQ